MKCGFIKFPFCQNFLSYGGIGIVFWTNSSNPYIMTGLMNFNLLWHIATYIVSIVEGSYSQQALPFLFVCFLVFIKI